MSETVKQEGDFKIKKKPGRPRKLNKKDEPIKVDLSKPVEKTEEKVEQQQDAIQVGETKELPDDTAITLYALSRSRFDFFATVHASPRATK